MVSKARLDLPDPDSPVMQIRRFRGRRTVMSLRLCSRAPWTMSSSAAMRGQSTVTNGRSCVGFSVGRGRPRVLLGRRGEAGADRIQEDVVGCRAEVVVAL